MNKYVRTKDGRIIEISEEIIGEGELPCFIGELVEIDVYRSVEIINRADTIEELCDELVLKDLDTNFCFVMNANHIKDIKDNWQNLMDNGYLKKHIIYGAIWTNKGLIYVAKMNDKGELELI